MTHFATDALMSVLEFDLAVAGKVECAGPSVKFTFQCLHFSCEVYVTVGAEALLRHLQHDRHDLARYLYGACLCTAFKLTQPQGQCH